MKKKNLAAIGLAGGLLAGGTAGFVLGAPGLVGAQEGEEAPAEAPSEELQDRAQNHIREALAPLVENGTITEDQMNAVVGALEDARPERRGGKRFFRGGLDNVAEVLNVTPEELRDDLREGQTLAEVAEAQGVDVQTVIDTMVADANARIDERVAEGRITAEEAEEKKAAVVKRITEKVNKGFQGRRGPGGPGGPDAPDSDDAPSEEDAEGSVLTS